jgi:VWFA-related protein
MAVRPFVTALLTGLLVVPAAAQAPAPAPQNPPVFTSAVDIARMDVRVTDKSGKPITDLRPDEVQVIEAGVTRPVVLLQRVAEAGRTYAESAQRTIAAEVSTNQGAPRGELYLLLFDQDHITPGTEQKVRLAAERFIKEKVQPQDRISIVGIPAPGPSVSFTSNTRAAIEQLQLVRGGLERVQTGVLGEMTVNEAFEILRGNDQVLQRFLNTSDFGTTSRASAIADTANNNKASESVDVQRRNLQMEAQTIVTRADGESRRFLQTAIELFHSLRNIDGRKTIILFSEGFHGDNVAMELRSVAAAAAEVYGVVYAFDLNARMDATATEPMGNDTAKEIQSRTETIGSLAAETSGALVTDALSHLDQALGAIGTPNNDYYIVGFESSAAALADRNAYQRVEVKVTRPGAVVGTRTGYTAGANARADTALASLRRLTIDSALAAPFGHQGLRVEYTTYQSHVTGTTVSERVVLSLEAELPVNAGPTTGDNAPKADVVFVVRDARTGRIAASGTDQIALPTTVSRGRTSGVGAWRVQFMLPPGDYIMRAIVREPGGLIGSADRQFNVRALGGPDVAPSDLILGRPTPALPVRATAYTAEPLPAAVRVYGRSAAQLDKITARIELLPVGGSAAVLGVTGVATDTRNVDGQELRDVLFEIPLTTVPAGDYVARLEIRANGEFVSELRRQVTVIVGANPSPQPAVEEPAAPAPSAAAEGFVATALMADAATSTSPAVRQAASGVTQLKAARYAEAAATLAAAFDASASKSASIAFLLGWAERGTGNLVGAVSAFRNAATLDPSMIPAHLALADTYVALKQPALAVQALEAGLASQPNSVELKRMLETIRK